MTDATRNNAPASIPVPKHLPFLDGVRALASLYVVLHHTRQYEIGYGAKTGLTGLLTNWMMYGHLAVDVFIVLSGFCLMLPVAHSGQINGGAVNFYFRRARRILPPLYFCLMFCLPLRWLIVHFGRLHYAPITYKTLLVNAFLLQDWIPGQNALDGTLWSVAAEWKIYFFFPLIVLLWRRFSSAGVLLFSAAVGYGVTAGAHVVFPKLGLSETCPWYLFLFTLGVCAVPLALQEGVPKPRQWTYMTLALGVGWLILLRAFPFTAAPFNAPYESHLPVIDALTGLLTAAAFIALTHKMRVPNPGLTLRLIASKPLVAVGTFAYSIYLVHVPLVGLVTALAHRLEEHHVPLGFVEAGSFFIAVPIIVCISYLFFLAFERPFLNTRQSVTPSLKPDKPEQALLPAHEVEEVIG